MASQIADRNLLFGVLALQMEFAKQEQIVAALDAWGHAKAKTLGDILVEQRVLDVERRQLLDAVLLQRLSQHGGDAALSLAALAIPPELHEQLSRLVDPDLQASVGRIAAATALKTDLYATNYGVGGVQTQPEIHLPADPLATDVPGATGARQPETAKVADPFATNLPSVGGPAGVTRTDTMGAPALSCSPAVAGAPPPASRFRVLKLHARGGLGEVLVAEDEEVHREVALKQIQSPHADNQDSRARFLAEAEITGALEHPGIVPVYGLGQYRDGRPYYAMRFIRGDSLKERLDHFHKQDTATRDPGERNLQLRELLERFVDVCEAVAYAHSRGIVHRDLKPGNIMLGKYGETLVVDWGLAKPIDEKEPIPENPDQKRVALSGTASASPTLMGAAVGTPQFMSPEQAAGQLDKLGPASDVYSLGATLYAVLTGVVPISDRDLVTLLQRVQKGDFMSPRSVKPNTPRALEAICLKAMALKPESRYPGAKELARDIERWLGDEPVTAYPEPWTARAARWMRKNPAAVAASIVAVPALVVIALVLNIYKAKEARAKDEAIKNYELARSAVDRYHTNVSESVLLNEPGMQPLRKQLLAAAQEFYAKFEKQHRDDDLTVQGELARARYRLGQITGDIESEKGAIVLLQKAAVVFAVDKSVDAAEIARCYHHLGRLYRLTDDFDKSVEWYEKALAVWESLGGANEEQQAGWARSQFGLGNVLQRQRQFNKARIEYGHALAMLDTLAQKKPRVPEYLRDKGVVHRNLGMVYAAVGDKDTEARAEFAKAIALQEQLIKDHPNLSKFQDDLASSHYTLGDVRFRTGKIKDCIAPLQVAVTIWQRLTLSHPAVLDYHVRLADGHAAVARALIAANQTDDAIKASERALEVLKHVADKSRELADKNEAPKYRGLLGRRFVEHADVLRRAGQSTAAERAYVDALSIQKQLVTEVPQTSDYQADLARTHNGLGRLYVDQKKDGMAETEFTRSLEIWEKLQKEHPESAEFAEGVAATFINLRFLTRSPGIFRITLAPLDRMLGIYASPAFNQQLPALRQALLQGHWTRAEAHATHGMFTEAIVDWAQAKQLAKKLAAESGKNEDYSWVSVYRTVTLAQYGQHEQATKDAEELVTPLRKRADALYHLARVFALSAHAAANKKGDDAEQSKKLAVKYADRACELLEEVRSLGFFAQADNRQRLTDSADWQFLRGRQPFDALLDRLSQKPANPKQVQP